MKLVTAMLVVLAAAPAWAEDLRPPILDMHLHADTEQIRWPAGTPVPCIPEPCEAAFQAGALVGKDARFQNQDIRDIGLQHLHLQALLEDPLKVISIGRWWCIFDQDGHLIVVDKATAVGHFFQASDLQALAGFQGADIQALGGRTILNPLTALL